MIPDFIFEILPFRSENYLNYKWCLVDQPDISKHKQPCVKRAASFSVKDKLLNGGSFLKGRPRRRWEDNIKMDLQEVEGGCGDWNELAQDRDRWRALVSTVRNFRVPKMRGIY